MATEIDQLTVGVRADTRSFETSLQALGREANGFSTAISRAFKDAVVGGKDFESVLSRLALRLSGLALDAALRPLDALVTNAVGSLLGNIGLASGGVVSAGQVRPFASGGVVAAPTYFPLRGGTGLMGEAGPEAVLPLTRGSDGRLGVRSEAGRSVNVTLNVTTPDAQSFRRSEGQVTTMLARAVGRGQRGL